MNTAYYGLYVYTCVAGGHSDSFVVAAEGEVEALDESVYGFAAIAGVLDDGADGDAGEPVPADADHDFKVGGFVPELGFGAGALDGHGREILAGDCSVGGGVVGLAAHFSKLSPPRASSTGHFASMSL